LEYNLLPGLDEMILETITPSARGNTLDPEVRNPALKEQGGVITSFSTFRDRPSASSTIWLVEFAFNIISLFGVLLQG
jgi:hypothetical protein